MDGQMAIPGSIQDRELDKFTDNGNSETTVQVETFDDLPIHTMTDVVNATTTFIGEAFSQTALSTDSVWRIRRLSVAGSLSITEYAVDGNGDASFTFDFDNASSFFPAIPFVNTRSILFDGANDFLDIANNAAIDFDFRTEAASWNGWIRTSDTTGSVTYLEKQSGTNPGWRFYLVSNRLVLELRGTGGTTDRIRTRGPTGTGAIINDGGWHMLSATYDGSGNASGVSLYVDGTALTPLDIQNDALLTDTSNSVNAAMASRTGGGNNYGPGHMDECSIWDVELTSGEITTIYNTGIPIDLQGQGVSPITVSLNWWSRNGDGGSDVFPNIIDVENSIVGIMTNMTLGDIQNVTPP